MAPSKPRRAFKGYAPDRARRGESYVAAPLEIEVESTVTVKELELTTASGMYARGQSRY